LPEGARDVAPNTGRGDDVDAGGARDISDERDVAAEVRRREVDDRIDPAGLRFRQLAYGIRLRALPVEQPRVVMVVLAHRDEHVLMAEREAEGAVVDGAEDGLDGGHRLYSSGKRRLPCSK